MVAKKLLNLANLARTQTLYLYESSKVIMVGEIKNLVFAAS